MKRTIILVIMMALLTGHGFSQNTIKIGDVRDSKLVITNQKALNAFFLNCLAQSGVPGKDLKIEPSPTADRFFVSSVVTGNRDKVTSIGVMLVVRNGEAIIVEARKGEGDSSGPGPGGSVSVQCAGNPCDQCYPTITWPTGQWYPSVVCHCSDPEGTCNMVMTILFNISVSY